MRVPLTALLGVLALGPLRPGAQSPALPQGDNALVGRVLETGSDQPVPGAQVSLIGYLDEDGQPANTFPVGVSEFFAASIQVRALTNADGVFVFRGLASGRYAISALAVGYGEPDGRTRAVDLDDDMPATVTLRLWRHAGISGRVTDERGEPVVGVPVSVLRPTSGGRSPTLRGGSSGADPVTDDRGEYRLGGLAPGSYLVGVVSTISTFPAALGAEADRAERFVGTPAWLALRDGGGQDLRSGAGTSASGVVVRETGVPPVLAPDGSVLTFPTTLYPGTTDALAAEVITLASGEDRASVDIPVSFSRTVRVSGVARGPEGPVSSLKVRLQRAADGVMLIDAIDDAGAITDAAGRFVLLGVSPGTYVMNAAWLPPGAEAGEAGAEATTLWVSAPISVGDRDIDDVNLRLRPGIEVSGRIDFADGGESPLTDGQRVTLVFRPFGAAAGMMRAAIAYMESDGTFTSQGLPPGRYQISSAVGCPGPGGCPTDWILQTVTRNGRGVPYDVIEIDAADAGLSGVTLRFARSGAAVTGSIVDADDEVNPHADAIVFPADTTLWQDDILSRRVRVVHATSEGSFEIDGLGPGDYYVVAVDSPYPYEDPGALDRLVPGATRVTLAAGEQVNVRLETYRPGEREDMRGIGS